MKFECAYAHVVWLEVAAVEERNIMGDRIELYTLLPGVPTATFSSIHLTLSLSTVFVYTHTPQCNSHPYLPSGHVCQGDAEAAGHVIPTCGERTGPHLQDSLQGPLPA